MSVGNDDAPVVLRVGGADARAFLQGQLSNDLRLLGPGNTLLASLNSPQGRVVAILRLFQRDDAIHAVLPRSLAATVVERLRKYVMRSKVTLALAEELVVVPLIGAPELVPEPASAEPAHVLAGEVSILACAQPEPRALLIGSAGNVAEVVKRQASSVASWNDWRLAQIAAGEPQVYAATSERFVAQMLNLDLLGAVSFAKGCYTGQEIIVRTQHLGRIKRRVVRLRVRGRSLEPGEKLTDDGHTVAEIVDVAAARDGGHQVLAVVTMTSLSGGAPTVAGVELQRLPLPYPVGDEAPADTTFMA